METTVSDANLIEPLATADNDRLASEWLNYLSHKRGRAKSTVIAYAKLIYRFAEWADERSLLEMGVDDMETFVNRPRERVARASNSTLHRDAAVLRSFYAWCVERGVLLRDPSLGLHTPTIHNVMPRSITDDHWMALWRSQAVQTSQKAVVALGLGFYCGLRRDEITHLRGEQVTDSHIVGFVRKGGGEDTLPWRSLTSVYASNLQPVAPAIKQFETTLVYLAQARGSDRLIGWQHPDAFNTALRSWTRRAQVPPITPHQLRHSAATNLLRCGVPLYLVSSMLNHRSIQTTMRYVRAGHDALAEWMDGEHGHGSRGRDRPPTPGGGEA